MSRTYTEDELEQEISRRGEAQKDLIADVINALTPKLEGLRGEIHAANGLKRAFGGKLTRLTNAVEATNKSLQTHVSLEGHPGTTAKFLQVDRRLDEFDDLGEEFGIADLSREQKQAVPAVLKAFLVSRQQRREEDRLQRRRDPYWLIGATLIGSLAGAVTQHIHFPSWL